ncbi:uncharacterized protein LOC112573540 isoform X2 [Pomacea canaliculata]|uniref:uncharacterized protein LOC112573540 isoform X2 n=1 Tax=Pomacea canaliculata TaxID=400727 RepID=UPI000D728D55|nr:uncharacterized protein LOC112573540 isoform X2 [Pomacea canaliculata]
MEMNATQTMNPNLADEEYATDVISQKHPPFKTELNWSSSESGKSEEYDMKTAEDQKQLLDETQIYSTYSSPEVSDDDTQRSFLHFTSTQVYDVLEGEDAGNLKKKNDTSPQAFETSKNEELNKDFIGATINANAAQCHLDQESENAGEWISPSPQENCLSMDQGKVFVSLMPTTTFPHLSRRKISEEETVNTKLYLTKKPTETNDIKQGTKAEVLREEEDFLKDKNEISHVSISNPNVKTNHPSSQLTEVNGCKVSVGQQENEFHIRQEMPDKGNQICMKENKNDFSISDNFYCNNLKDERQVSATDVFDCTIGDGLAISLKKKDEILQHTLGCGRRKTLTKPKALKSVAKKSEITKDIKKPDKSIITSVDGTSNNSYNMSTSKNGFIRRSSRIQTQVSNSRDERVKTQSEEEENRRSTRYKNVLIKRQSSTQAKGTEIGRHCVLNNIRRSNRIQTQVSNSRDERVKRQSEEEENRRSTRYKNVPIKRQSYTQAKGTEIGRHCVLNTPKGKMEIKEPYKKKRKAIKKCQGHHVKSGNLKKEIPKDVSKIKKNTRLEEFKRNLTRELSTQDSKCQKLMGFDNEEVTASRQESRQQRKFIKRKLHIPEDTSVSPAKRLLRSNLTNTLNSNKDVLHVNEEIMNDQNIMSGLTSKTRDKCEAGFQDSSCQKREQRILDVKLICCKGAKTKIQIDRKTKDVHKKRKDFKEKKRRDFQLRHKTDLLKPKVTFTGVVDESGQKIVKELGGEVDQHITDCTHLVTDKEEGMLEAKVPDGLCPSYQHTSLMKTFPRW